MSFFVALAVSIAQIYKIATKEKNDMMSQFSSSLPFLYP